MTRWVIAAAVVLGLCVLNASLGDEVQEAQAAAEHKREAQQSAQREARMKRLTAQANAMLYPIGQAK